MSTAYSVDAVKIASPDCDSESGHRSMDETDDRFIVQPEDRILITGAAGFIGSRVAERLASRGFRNLVCFTRSSSQSGRIDSLAKAFPETSFEVFYGNLLSRKECEMASRDVKVIFHLAAGTGEKSVPDAFMNSVVATRNLLDAALQQSSLRRLVLVSSFAVYTNRQRSRHLTEESPIEDHPERLGDAYCYAKVRQEQIVRAYGESDGLPYVVVRPGSVYGPGNREITGRVGLATFGVFVHLGGSNRIPFTYVDNCADAIALAGLVRGIDGEVFNVMDDDLPSSRQFLRLYKKSVRRFRSLYVPHAISYALCFLWEKYSAWSEGQLPPAYTRRQWYSQWRKTLYSNEKLKSKLGWKPHVSTAEGFRRTFAAYNGEGRRA